MATLPKMIQVFQPLDGRDIATLTQHGRVLREAGLIPAGKRGVGAPQMTAQHAAILLLGIFGSATPKDGPVAVDRMSDLKHHFTDGPMADMFESFTGRQRLGDTLATLIERAPEFLIYFFKIIEHDRDWTEEQIDLIRRQTERGGGLIGTEIKIGAVSAEIRANWGDQVLFNAIYMVDSDRYMAGDYNSIQNRERKVTVSFTFRTIAALYEAVAGDVIDLSEEFEAD